MIKWRLITFSWLLVATTALAVSKSILSNDLSYRGAPIDSLCFFNSQMNTHLIKLQQCGVKAEKLTIKSQNTELIQQGFIGFDWENRQVSYPSQGYSYYKTFPAGSHRYWVYTLNNSGGSGDFTAIQSIERKNLTTLAVMPVVSGDRCNGGISDVKVEHQHFIFRVHLTAFDLLALVNSNSHHLKPYDDLAACAVCCVAKAVYQLELGSKQEVTPTPKLQYVEWDGQTMTPSQMVQQGRHQACFNRLLSSASKGKSALNRLELKRFVNDFNQHCVH